MALILFGFNVIIYLAFTFGIFFSPRIADGVHSLAAVSGQLAAAPWTLLSYAFLHESFGHLFANLATLFIFTRVLGRLSAATWAAVYFAGAVVSALGFFALDGGSFGGGFGGTFGGGFGGQFAGGSVLMGASGAISALAGFAAVLLRQPQLIAVLVLINVASSFFIDGIAFSAHICGLLYGAAVALIWQRLGLKI